MISFQKNILCKAKKWFVELQNLDNIKISRCVKTPTFQVVTDQSFHVFSDASEDAYAAVINKKDVYEDGSVSITFFRSKSKVVPLTSYSIPQLELLGAILGLHLCQMVSNVLGGHVMKKSLLWCGSRKFKSFVANQIDEIQTTREPTQ